jgi:membrane fusion protein (multidrug efflux system)
MKKRMILMLTGLAAFITVLAVVKAKQVQAAVAHFASFQPPPEAVTTIVVRQEQWPATWSAIGTAAATRGVTVSADLAGIVDRISFESGRPVREGEVLVRLDVRQEQAQLAAAEARLELARLSLERMRGLVEKGIAAQADLDRADAEYKQAAASVGEIHATIERKTIRAPFSGVLGLRQVNLGQYLKSGDPIVPLQSLDPIYVNFSVPQQQQASLKIGGDVRVSIEGSTAALDGKVTAVNSIIDEATRNVEVQSTFANPAGKLRPGMFVTVNVGVGAPSAVIALPASSINYAPYGDSVFVVEDMKNPKSGQTYKGVRQQFVKLGAGRGDQVAVLSGLKPGDEVVTSGVFKLRQGTAVQVNNATQPSNSPAPKPEDS